MQFLVFFNLLQGPDIVRSARRPCIPGTDHNRQLQTHRPQGP